MLLAVNFSSLLAYLSISAEHFAFCMSDQFEKITFIQTGKGGG